MGGGLRGNGAPRGCGGRGKIWAGNLEAWEGVLRLGRGPRRPTCKGLAGGRAGGSGVEGGQAALNVGLEGRDELAELRRARRARSGVGMGDGGRRGAGRAGGSVPPFLPFPPSRAHR